MLGNLVVGVLFERMPPELSLGVSCLIMAGALMTIPFCHTLWILMAVSVVNGFGQGVLGSGDSCQSNFFITYILVLLFVML